MTRNAGKPALWVAAAAAPVLIVHALSLFHRLLDGDEAIYGSIAALMNLGDPLYAQGGVDNKPPGIFWVYAVTFRVFGTYQMTAIHAIALLTIAATCVLIFVAGRQLARSPGGGLATSLFCGVKPAGHAPLLLRLHASRLLQPPLPAPFFLLLRHH